MIFEIRLLSKANTGEVVKAIVDNLNNKSRELAIDIYKRSQELVPVDTGRLKKSGGYRKIENGEYEVAYYAPYAIFVHELVNNKHPNGGQAKFLEDAYYEVIGKAVREGKI